MPLRSAAFSPDGRHLATGSGFWDESNTPGEAKIWDVPGKREIVSLSGHKGAVMSVLFSPDGKTLVTGSNDGTVRFWDAAGTRELRAIAGFSDWPGPAPVFSPDGRVLATANWGSPPRLKLWDVGTGREIATLPGPGDQGTLAFSPDGERLAGAGGTALATVTLWNVRTRRQIATLRGQSGPVYMVAFSPDGKTLVTPSMDDTVILWSVHTLQPMVTLKLPRGHASVAAFSPDGRTLVTSAFDGDVQQWRAPSFAETHAMSLILPSRLPY